MSVDSTEQPVEPSKPINIQDSKSELEEELEQGEGCHLESKPGKRPIQDKKPRKRIDQTHNKRGHKTLMMNWKWRRVASSINYEPPKWYFVGFWDKDGSGPGKYKCIHAA